MDSFSCLFQSRLAVSLWSLHSLAYPLSSTQITFFFLVFICHPAHTTPSPFPCSLILLLFIILAILSSPSLISLTLIYLFLLLITTLLNEEVKQLKSFVLSSFPISQILPLLSNPSPLFLSSPFIILK